MNYYVLLDKEEAKVVTIYSYNRMTYLTSNKIMNISSLDISLYLDYSRSP
jgi:hypothetical protein